MELERPGKKEFVYLQIVQNNTRSIATKNPPKKRHVLNPHRTPLA